jgi:signal peptidase I
MQPVTDAFASSNIRPPWWREVLDFSWYFVRVLIVVIIAYFFIRDNMYRSFAVEGVSMAPNYATKDEVFVNKFATTFGDLARGDVVVIQRPAPECPDKIESNEDCFFIKRVVGLPGDVLIFENGDLFIQNERYKVPTRLDESVYLPLDVRTFAKVKGESSSDRLVTPIIPDNYYFVLGDNREQSKDSRLIGVVKRKEIQGKEFYRKGNNFFVPPKYNIDD